jgi:hypothetical protein
MERSSIYRAAKRATRLATIALSGAALIACVEPPDELDDGDQDEPATATVEQNGAIVPCPANIDDVSFGFRGTSGIYFYQYTILSSTPVFLPSEGRVLDNQTAQPVMFQIQTIQSQTFQVTVTTGFQQSLTKELTQTVSTQIQASRTTALNVQFNTTVPPFTRFLAQYGVESFHVSFGTSVWRLRGSNNVCEEWGWYPQTTIAPTTTEGWRLTTM